jgi:B-cell receptor-associated protein 31
MLLMVETAVFLALIVPMPVSARQRLFRFLSENPVVAKIQYGLKVRSPLPAPAPLTA